jgi:hypothetical protein
MRSDLPAGLSLLGFSKDPPLHRSAPKSPSPGTRVSAFPFGEGQPVLLAFRPRGFAPPRRFAPLRRCRCVSPCSRSWGSPCFRPSRNGLPHGVVPALRSFPSADSGRAGTCPSPRARVTGATITGRSLHRVPCPLTLHSVHRAAGFPAHVRLGDPVGFPVAAARSRGLEALLHRRVRCSRLRFQMREPGAPLGLADSAAASPPPFVPPCGGTPPFGSQGCGARACKTGMVRQRPLRATA